MKQIASAKSEIKYQNFNIFLKREQIFTFFLLFHNL
jgi:hypothetical protein